MMWLIPWGFSVGKAVLGRIYAASWVEGGTQKWKHAKGATAVGPDVPALHMEESSVLLRDMQRRSYDHVLFSQHSAQNEGFLGFYLATEFFFFVFIIII